MPRLNIKPTKAAIEKLIVDSIRSRATHEEDTPMHSYYSGKVAAAIELAKELEIDIKPEEYQG